MRGHCPLCNASLESEGVLYERAVVCLDCYDVLSGHRRGKTRDQRARDELLAEQARRRRELRWRGYGGARG